MAAVSASFEVLWGSVPEAPQVGPDMDPGVHLTLRNTRLGTRKTKTRRLPYVPSKTLLLQWQHPQHHHGGRSGHPVVPADP